MSNTLKKSPEMMGKHSWTETGTAIFAVLNSITAIFGLLICLFVLVLYIYEEITHTDKIDTFMWSFCGSANLLAIVSFVFAVVLFLGLNQKKPRFLLAYIIFGVIVLMSIVCGLVVLQLNLDSFVNEKLHEAFCEYYEPVWYATIVICVVAGIRERAYNINCGKRQASNSDVISRHLAPIENGLKELQLTQNEILERLRSAQTNTPASTLPAQMENYFSFVGGNNLRPGRDLQLDGLITRMP